MGMAIVHGRQPENEGKDDERNRPLFFTGENKNTQF